MDEALYIVRFTFRGVPNQGVVVLETGKVFGGDSGYYWIGTYEFKDKKLIGTIQVIHHNPAVPSIFGPGVTRFDAVLEVSTEGPIFHGVMQAMGQNISVQLEKKENLP